VKSPFRRNVGRGSLAAAFAAVLALSVAAPVQAADGVDQSQTIMEFFPKTSIPWVAQTFTAGLSGQVDRVSVGSKKTSSLIVRVSLRDVDLTTRQPGAVLGTATADSGTWSQGFRDFRFDPAISIVSGHSYAIAIQTVTGFSWYYSSDPDSYRAGELWVCGSICSGWSHDTTAKDLAFKTWVVGATSTNVAPKLAANGTAVTVDEGGQIPTNSGTYFDEDGDNVTVTASTGTASKTGTSSGTWTWTGLASDEGSATVTITAADGHGNSSLVSFSVTYRAVAPTVTISGPSSVAEGSSILLTGSATTKDTSDIAAGFKYAWYLGQDCATTEPIGSAATYTFTPLDNGIYDLTLCATDDGNMTGKAQATVVATNVDPTAAITSVVLTSPIVLTSGQTVTFNGTFTDPGVLDTHQVTWLFGDGASAAQDFGPGGSGTSSSSHAYDGAGTYTVTLVVTDKDGGQGTARTTVTVMTAAQALSALEEYVKNLSGLSAGQKNSLISKLEAAAAAFGRGDLQACDNQLDAFLRELRADFNAGKISSSDAANLSGAVLDVKGSLGVYNRFLGWLPLVF